jgi:hypothetical protein
MFGAHFPSLTTSYRGPHKLRYDGATMMSRTQITLAPEMQRRARQRASDLGVSLAEYLRRLLARDLGSIQAKADPVCVFDLGSSGGSDIAKNKSAMIAEAFAPVG